MWVFCINEGPKQNEIIEGTLLTLPNSQHWLSLLPPAPITAEHTNLESAKCLPTRTETYSRTWNPNHKKDHLQWLGQYKFRLYPKDHQLSTQYPYYLLNLRETKKNLLCDIRWWRNRKRLLKYEKKIHISVKYNK